MVMNPKKTDVSPVATDKAKGSGTGGTGQQSGPASGRGYFPPYPMLQQAVSEDRNSRGELVALRIPKAIFAKFLRNYYDAVGFDEAGYLERNPDVVEGIKQGRVKSALDHFVNNGFYEGRLANYVRPEDVWYL